MYGHFWKPGCRFYVKYRNLGVGRSGVWFDVLRLRTKTPWNVMCAIVYGLGNVNKRIFNSDKRKIITVCNIKVSLIKNYLYIRPLILHLSLLVWKVNRMWMLNSIGSFGCMCINELFNNYLFTALKLNVSNTDLVAIPNPVLFSARVSVHVMSSVQIKKGPCVFPFDDHILL